MLPGRSGLPAERKLLIAGAAAFLSAGVLAFVLLPPAEGSLLPASAVPWIVIAGAASVVAGLVAVSISLLRGSARELRADFAAVDRANRDLERRLAERTSNLKEANEEIRRISQVVERDLRPPLSNIIGFTGELEAVRAAALGKSAAAGRGMVGEAEDPEAKALRQDFDGALWFIRSSVSKMDRVIGAVVDLSEVAQREFKAEIVDLDRLVRALAADFSHGVEKGGVRLAVGKLPSVVSDRGALEQILANLVDNAIKYLRDEVPGHVGITARETDDGMVEIAVTDNGRGIAAEDQPRIFDLFRRAGTLDKPGDGVGLAVARTLARRLGGSIRIESTPREGSTFTVVLPKSRTP